MSSWLTVQPAEIPAELRALPWVLWRAEQRGPGKPTKVPYQVRRPRAKASSTDPTTWATFEDAVDAYFALPDITGIGCVLGAAAHISCIDLDHVLAAGELDVRAETILDHANSWTEISPSGTGLHIFVRGAIEEPINGIGIEVYSDARYIAVTGHRWRGTPVEVHDGQRYLDALLASYRAHHGRQVTRPRYHGPAVPPPDDLAGALLAKLQTWGVPVARLKRWNGGFLVELETCPWADEHTTGPGGAAGMIHASGAFDFTCLHAHCAGRSWRDFRAAMESR